MKIEVYEDDGKVPEQVVRLRLLPGRDGQSSRVVAVRPDGTTVTAGNLVVFNSDGTLTLEASVANGIGFDLDANGRIVVRKF